jgi:hypothetical protein
VQFTRTYEGPPTVAITSSATSPTTLSPIPVTITFSEPVSGLLLSEITVINGTASNLTGTGAVYTVSITPTAAGNVTVRVPAGVVASVADSELNLASADFVIEFTGVRPTVTITTTAGVATSTVPIPVTITFSEAVTGFVPGDIIITNGAAVTAFTSSTTTVYQIEVTPLAVGDVTIEVPADVAVDADTLGNTEAVPLVIEYLGDLPEVVSITRLDFSPTTAAQVRFLVTFSEAVFDVTTADFELTTTGSLTGAALVSTTGTGLTRTVTVSTGTGMGTLRLIVPEEAEIEDEDENLIEELPFVTGEVYQVRMATFADVPMTYWAWEEIEILYNNDVTDGCSTTPTLRFCPNDNVTRAEMAKFLLTAINGAGYEPTIDTLRTFVDVSPQYWAYEWIENLFEDGLTNGCSQAPLKYCPNDYVTRAEMAKFLLSAMNADNPLYKPPTVFITSFTDVPMTYWAKNWIEELYDQGVTTGCSQFPLSYCPEGYVTRAEMAVFLVRAFDLD